MKVMIVDDSPVNLKLLRISLEAEGFEVVEAEDGVVALGLLGHKPVDAIISDILMPNMDGYRLCHEIRHHPLYFNLPFIIYTGTYRSPEDEKRALELGVDKYLTKDSPANQVINAVREVMAGGGRHRKVEPDQPQEELKLVKLYSESLVQKLKAKNLEIAAAEAKFRALVEQSIAGIYVIQQERFVYVNPRMADILGMTAEDISSRPLYDFIAPEDRPMVRENIRKRMEGIVPDAHYTLRMLHKTGRVLQIEAHGVRMDYEGRSAITGTLLDITDRKKSELLITAFSTLAHLLSSTQTIKEAGAIIIDVADHLFGWDSCNLDLYTPETNRIFSIINKDLIDGRRDDCAPPYHGCEPSPRARRTIAEGAQLILREAPLVYSPDSQPFGNNQPWASIMSAPIRDGAKIVGILSIQSYRLRAYSREDLAAFQALADHCAGALNRIAAHEAQTRQAEYIAAFSNLGQKLSSAQSALEAGKIILDSADLLFGWDAATLDLYSPDTQEIFPVLTMDLVDGQRTTIPDAPGGRPPGPKMEKTIKEGAQLFQRETTTPLPADFRPFGNKLRASASVMYVPIRHGAGIFGLLSIQSYAPSAYDREDLQGLQSLADHCAGALQRIKAGETLQQRMAELERFHRVSVGRELQMIDLKKEINQLAQQLGQPPPYRVPSDKVDK